MINSGEYWENRYATGGNSGAGSEGQLAQFKATTINNFVKHFNIYDVIEFGCGDGRQVELYDIPKYIGCDISDTAVEMCKRKFEKDCDTAVDKKRFYNIYELFLTGIKQVDATMSIDVIFHLIEDDVYKAYMENLFDCAKKYVIIYSSNSMDTQEVPHVKHRKFTEWVEQNRPEWKMKEIIKNPYKGDDSKSSFCDFYIYEKC